MEVEYSLLLLKRCRKTRWGSQEGWQATELRRTAFTDGLPAVLSSEAFAEEETPKSRVW